MERVSTNAQALRLSATPVMAISKPNAPPVPLPLLKASCKRLCFSCPELRPVSAGSKNEEKRQHLEESTNSQGNAYEPYLSTLLAQSWEVSRHPPFLHPSSANIELLPLKLEIKKKIATGF